MTWLLTALKLLPQVLRLVQSLADLAAFNRGRGMGRQEALAEALSAAAANIDKARAAEESARADHKARPNDDAAFDPDVFRKEV